MPRVSVCIPTYNSAHFLKEAIDSVLAQELPDFELVISDNASTDGTPELCRTYSDPRIRYVRFEELVGQAGNWNRCVELAQCDLVALLHADDRYLAGFLAQRVRALEARPEVGLAFGAVRIIDAQGKVLRHSAFRDEAFVVPAPEFFKELLFGCVVNPVSPMVRRECYRQVGRFREDRKLGIDTDMWMRIAQRYAVAYDPEPLAEYRVHDGSGTAEWLAGADFAVEDLLLLNETFEDIEARPELARFSSLRPQAYRHLALRSLFFAGEACRNGKMAAVRKHLELAIQADRSITKRPTTWALQLSLRLGPGIYRAFSSLRGRETPSGIAQV